MVRFVTPTSNSVAGTVTLRLLPSDEGRCPRPPRPALSLPKGRKGATLAPQNCNRNVRELVTQRTRGNRKPYEPGFKSFSDIGEWSVVNCYNYCLCVFNFITAFSSVCC